MPRIQQYVAQGGPQPGPANLAAPQAFGSVPNVGETIGTLAQFLDQKAERDQAFQIKKDMAKVRGDWMARLNELEQNAPAGAPDFTKTVMDEYRAAMQQMTAERSLSRANADSLALEQEQTGNVLLQRAMTFEAQERAKKRRTDALAYSADVSRHVFLNPFLFSMENDKLPETFGALGLTGAALDETLRVVRADLAQNAIKGLIERGDLNEARAAIAEGPTSQYVSGDLAASLTNAIHVEERRREAEARQRAALAKAEAMAVVQVLRDDVTAEISATGRSANLESLKTAIRTAYGEKPEIASRMVNQLDNAVTFYTERTAIAGNSPEQDAAYLERLRGEATGTNAAQKLNQLAIATRAVRDKREALDEDGFTYVLQTNPQLRQAMSDGANDPEKFRRVVATIDQKQADLGVPSWRRTYFGKAQAASTAAELNAAVATDPEKVANRIETLAASYGPLWSNVLNELVGQGLNETLAVAARFDKPTDAVARVDLVRAIAAASANRKVTDEKAMTDIRAQLQTEMTDFAKSLAAYGPAGAALVARERAAAEALAMSILAANGGRDPAGAARKAAETLVNSRYDFADTYRTPKGLGSAVDGAARQVLRQLSADVMAPAMGGDPALSEEYRRTAALRAAQGGRWINTPDGKGIELHQQDGRPVVLRSGARVRLMFDALPELERSTDGLSGVVAP
jgi:hypothetical protein